MQAGRKPLPNSATPHFELECKSGCSTFARGESAEAACRHRSPDPRRPCSKVTGGARGTRVLTGATRMEQRRGVRTSETDTAGGRAIHYAHFPHHKGRDAGARRGWSVGWCIGAAVLAARPCPPQPCPFSLYRGLARSRPLSGVPGRSFEFSIRPVCLSLRPPCYATNSGM